MSPYSARRIRQPSGPRARQPQPAGSVVRRDILALLTSKAVRETIESVVIAFALAFLFRTFEAEAFVIPTGSMAATLQGRHQEVTCPMCGYAYRISASQEIDQGTELKTRDVAVGTCPNCGYTTCTNLALGRQLMQREEFNVPFNTNAVARGADSKSKSGDRILVNKFAYEFQEPERWDVFVFRYPGQSSRNYIKRLVGLPNETLKIHRGDIFTADYDPRAGDEPGLPLQYEIQRKPPHKIRAMMQIVHDNNYQAADLIAAGWPPRWLVWPPDAAHGAGDWTASEDHRSFTTDGSAPQETWIRYQHTVPSIQDWERVIHPDWFPDYDQADPRPQLITDGYPYNSSVGFPFRRNEWGQLVWLLGGGMSADHISPFGMHWVGDLVVECQLQVHSSQGQAIVELVEGGHVFQLRIDLTSGLATVAVDGSGKAFGDEGQPVDEALPQASTLLGRPGTYRVAMANVDDQLVVWIDDAQLVFDRPTTYRPLNNGVPQWDAQQQRGDLAPVGIGSLGASLRVDNLRVLRDIYYIAADTNHTGPDYLSGLLSDHRTRTRADWNLPLQERRLQLLSTPEQWPEAFGEMASSVFPLAEFPHNPRADQFLALGDNSPQSKDSRLWSFRIRNPATAEVIETEHFVERRLLVGKALAIYWPLTHVQFVR